MMKGGVECRSRGMWRIAGEGVAHEALQGWGYIPAVNLTWGYLYVRFAVRCAP